MPLTATVTLGFAGIECADYYVSGVESVVVQAVATMLDGVEEDNVGSTTCFDSSRRRRLQQRKLDAIAAASISFGISVPATSVGDDGAGFVTSLSSSLGIAVSSGALSSAIASAAADAGITSLADVGVTGVTVAGAPTLAPTAAPSAPPEPPRVSLKVATASATGKVR
jgi:hypothetical protein